MAYHVEGKAEVLHHHPDGVALVTAEGSVPATVEKTPAVSYATAEVRGAVAAWGAASMLELNHLEHPVWPR